MIRWPLVSRHGLAAAEGRASVLKFENGELRNELRELGVCNRSAEERYLDALMKLSASDTTVQHLRERIADLQHHIERAEADKERLQDLAEAQALNLRTEAPKPVEQPAEVRSVTGYELIQRAEKHRAAHPRPLPRPLAVRPAATAPAAPAPPAAASGGQS